MSFKMINVTSNGAIARIELNRPEKLNSFDEATVLELLHALDELEADQRVRVLVLTGVGRAFCAGQDLADPAMQTIDGKLPDIGSLVERLVKPLVLKLQNLHMPTIAAVNGLAAGGGAALALACDIVVAARSAYFLQAFSRIGLTPDTGSTWFLSQRLGAARAMGLMMLADKLPANKAAEWGLIWDVIDDADFASGVDALAERLAAMPTKALARTRQLVLTAGSHSLEQQLSMEATCIREMGWRSDYAEGVLAFSQKRTPNFTGE
jgi:2-(1,2-epoxy-1,2-dihydrophenyl)acetyl-CoA isomerase